MSRFDVKIASSGFEELCDVEYFAPTCIVIPNMTRFRNCDAFGVVGAELISHELGAEVTSLGVSGIAAEVFALGAGVFNDPHDQASLNIYLADDHPVVVA